MSLTVIALVAALGSSAWQMADPDAGDWVVLYAGPEAVVAVDRTSVRREQDIARYRVAVAPPAGGRYGHIPYAYQIAHWRVDCRAMAGTVLDSRQYDQDATEIDVRSLGIPPLNTAAEPLRQGTPIHRFADAACNDHWGEESPLASARSVYARSQRGRQDQP